jgi:hypothetical protein
MSNDVTRAQKELWAAACDQRALCYRLLGIAATLPALEAETATPDIREDEMTPAAEIRFVIQCVLRDHLEPALASLQHAARYRAGAGRKDKEELP